MTMAPLDGIQILDFTELLPGPFLSQNLVEMGATVTKLERPGHGDNARVMAPGIFQAVNRGKQCISIDLKSAHGREQVEQWLQSTDVLLEAYRPGVMQRLGLDYASLRTRYPRLVYASLSGYGQSGTRSLWPGHDLNYAAASGALALSGRSDGRPEHAFGLPAADLCGSMYGLSAVLAALFQRSQTGQGQYLDIALADCLAHWMNPRLGSFAAQGLHTLEQQRQDVLDKPAYGVFRCKDGQEITICALENHFWQRLVDVLALHEWSGEEFMDYEHRAAHAAAIGQTIAQRVQMQDSAALHAALLAADIPVMRLVLPSDLLTDSAAAGRALHAFDGSGFVRFPVQLDGMSEVDLSPGTAP
ncbi:CaiB/BaiF CoA transferase family protein [Lampropedia aestuarii]|uniref:CaiB/BaiF CoA transferase family protein n=1 Tax=Lampropedia aestuarii TaxID=2562762 RepID=UPI0024687164|nr:CaiB/BaiF CoA-transferase family protein [Lampropedia aestuarii]MDH5855926.1 CaiB/BaiF CoA-transferase family protein [Lampropedia aestuarii]